MRALPKWYIAISGDCNFCPGHDHKIAQDKVFEALAIAWEALETMQRHSGRTVYQYEEMAIDALRRITKLGEE